MIGTDEQLAAAVRCWMLGFRPTALAMLDFLIVGSA